MTHIYIDRRIQPLLEGDFPIAMAIAWDVLRQRSDVRQGAYATVMQDSFGVTRAITLTISQLNDYLRPNYPSLIVEALRGIYASQGEPEIPVFVHVGRLVFLD